MMRSLGGAVSVGTSDMKKVAVRVVLKMPVYFSSGGVSRCHKKVTRESILIKFPRSKINFCGSFQNNKYCVMSLR